MDTQSAAAPGQARLETAIVDSIPLGLYVLDRDWRFLYMNALAERFFLQLTSRSPDELLSKSIWETCPEVADSTFSKEYQQAVVEQRTFELETYYPQLKRWFAILAPFAPDIRCVYFRDVTERTRLERELRLRVEQLAASDRGKDQFLVHLAHEVRNALAPVRNGIHVLSAHSEGGATVTEAQSLAEAEIRYLSRLMEDLLRVAQLSHAADQALNERYDLAAVVGRALQAVITSARGRGRQFNVSLPPEPLWLEGDPGEIEEVLGQLLDNAAHFTPPDGSIWLSAQREENAVVLRVRDNGVGIAPELLPNVFNLFMRGERFFERTQGGLGVGLTLVRKLVQRQGGTVEALSAGPGRGSEFVVHLPIPSPQQETPEKTAAMTDGAATQGMRVLVVDNSLDAVQSLAILLKDWGYQVREAYDGASGLREAEKWRPDVVVLDIGMPGMDGYEVARRLRQGSPDGLVLVALTGFGEDEDRRRAREAGFDFHLLKPVSPEELHDLLGMIVSSSQTQAAAVPS
jgi:signal transduction histidine kinase/ActR/RegA family two-component response regulator